MRVQALYRYDMYNNILTHHDVTRENPSDAITYCDVIMGHETKK